MKLADLFESEDDFDFTTKDGIAEWLKANHIWEFYDIHDDLSVSVFDNINITVVGKDKSKIPVKFRKAYLFLTDVPITSLENFPDSAKEVVIQSAKIKNLQRITQDAVAYSIQSCQELESLDGLPQEVNGSIYINRCPITSLKGAPLRIDGDFSVVRCGLKSLRYGPREVSGLLDIRRNELTSLKGCPEGVDYVDATNNLIRNLIGVPESVDELYLTDNPLESLDGLHDGRIVVRSIGANISKEEKLKYPNATVVTV